MNVTTNTRDRHALRWVLGAGLVFVVVVGMGLQAAQRRAKERWFDVLTSWEADALNEGLVGSAAPGVPHAFVHAYTTFNRGGNVLRGWGEYRINAQGSALVIRQERGFFGSSIEARISGGEPEQVDAVRAILAAVDVDLIVEP